MRLIKTNDGAIGLVLKGKTIWCNTQQEALNLMWGHFGPRQQLSKEEIAKDLAYAMDCMARKGHSIAEFGVLGSFMFSFKEEYNTF